MNHIHPAWKPPILRPPARVHARRGARGGFTLIEILVALAVFSVLLVIIMVPLSQGVSMTQIGSARAETQQAAQTLMTRITSELRRATYVFPNEAMVGITDKAPYTNNRFALTDALGHPYLRTSSGAGGFCDADAATRAFSNTGRLDILVPAAASSANLADRQALSVVSFYTARTDVTKSWEQGDSYMADLNPIVMYRAHIPFRRQNGAQFLDGTLPNALVDEERFPSPTSTACTNNAAYINRGTRWLMHNGAGEPELARPDAADRPNPAGPTKEDLTAGTGTEPVSNSRLSPLGIGMYAPEADKAPDTANLAANQKMFTPSTSFICEDTNGNGVIDRVTVTLVMGKYDGGGAENRAQSVRLVQTVDLPNTESRFGTAR
jgi:prepilin-type N-terminal cleavage/methylation domain-containing protein